MSILLLSFKLKKKQQQYFDINTNLKIAKFLKRKALKCDQKLEIFKHYSIKFIHHNFIDASILYHQNFAILTMNKVKINYLKNYDLTLKNKLLRY